MIGRTVRNAGVPGEVTADGLARLPTVLDEVRPALVVLCHGGNDMLQGLSNEKTSENLRQMIRVTRERGADIILVGVPQPGLGLSTARFYRRIAGELAVPYEGHVSEDILSKRALKSDAIHPNAAGYRRMAEAVARVIRESGGV